MGEPYREPKWVGGGEISPQQARFSGGGVTGERWGIDL